MQTEKKVTSAEKGTALHTVMQHLPLDEPLNKMEIEELIERLVEKEIMTRVEADIVDIEAIEQFYQTEIAQMMMESTEIQREVPFSLTLPASEVYANWESDTDEKVLIQGVIDCLIPKDDGWIILDYKTDAIDSEVTDSLREQLIGRYETQLNLYRQALEEIWKQPVKGTYLYFFAKQLLLEVPKQK